MKRLIIMAAFLSVCMLSIAQTDGSYSMRVYLSDGSVDTYSVSEVDSVVFVELCEINGYEYVNLGLSVLWATCNIGADSPEDYGNYYAWGETETKSSYSESNSVTYYVSMSDISGNATYDAATANWGDPWRMPTYDEMKELVDSCTWEYTSENAVNGYLITGPTGNSIFLPAAGYRQGTTLYYAGSYGNYWSSMPSESNTYHTWYLYFDSVYRYMDLARRYGGRSVRPVSDY